MAKVEGRQVDSTYKLIYGRMQPPCGDGFYCSNGFQTPSSTKTVTNHRLIGNKKEKEIRRKYSSENCEYHHDVVCRENKMNDDTQAMKERERERERERDPG